MLVVTRKPGQKVLVGENIEVSIGRVLPDGRVRLCISAPPSVRVIREELLVRGEKR
jgi:carbon storage regulator